MIRVLKQGRTSQFPAIAWLAIDVVYPGDNHDPLSKNFEAVPLPQRLNAK